MSYPKDPYYEKAPTGGSYPQMAAAPTGQYFPPSYPSAPPPYSAVAPAGPGAAVPTYQPAPYAYGTAGVPGQPYSSSHMVNSAPPPYVNYGQPAFNPGYPVQQGFAYSVPPVAAAQFDAGARFDGIASQNIPPPPPGYAPNAAQMAAAHGGTVIATQKKSNWFSGNGGGVSFW
ncbi:unnamed protein product [Candidula unifasciata]|uniref:DAZ-associated protein 2 n=1 Tax=Candidula unifasciata TaxID=100452 RepID=A0A8S3Z7K8_9EUPU|nr:unnamed protein product [Candidula unifasciata]